MQERGDLEQGFAEADVVIEREFTTKMVHQGYIEPHAAIADTTPNGRSTIWCTSQGQHSMRAMTATVLGWAPSRLKVIPSEIGGGFGGKMVIYLEPLAVALSQKAGRPVRLVMDRDEVFRATGPTSGTRSGSRSAPGSDGTLTAAEVWLAYEAGAFPGSRRRRRRDVLPRPLPAPELQDRGLRRRRQQAEDGGATARPARRWRRSPRRACSTRSPASWGWTPSSSA